VRDTEAAAAGRLIRPEVERATVVRGHRRHHRRRGPDGALAIMGTKMFTSFWTISAVSVGRGAEATLVRKLLDGHYENPARIVAFCWSRNVTVDIADELRRLRRARRGASVASRIHGNEQPPLRSPYANSSAPAGVSATADRYHTSAALPSRTTPIFAVNQRQHLRTDGR